MKTITIPLSDSNQLFKYADDTTLLVPENSDVDLADEFNHIKGLSEIFLPQLCRWRLLASGRDRRQTLHTCYFWQAASAGVHSTVPAHSKCAYAA